MAQASAAIPAVMRATDGSRFFLVGNDYVWPRAVNWAAWQVIERAWGSIADEAYAPLGTSTFQPVIEKISEQDADVVISTFIGADEVAFEQQIYAAGLRAKVQTLAFALDESTHEYSGPRASADLWTAISYLESLPSTENADFLAARQAAPGHRRPRSWARAGPSSSVRTTRPARPRR